MHTKRGDYRAHKRSALSHFRTQWATRIADEMPDLDLIRAELRRAVEGQESAFFTLAGFNHYSTRWRAHFGGKTLIVAYHHNLRVPVSVWEEGVDYRKVEPRPVKMEDYRRAQEQEKTAGGTAEAASDAGTDAEQA